MKTALIAGFLLFPIIASAADQPKATKVKLTDSGQNCVLQDKAYPIGATLKNNGVTLECIKMKDEDGSTSNPMWKLKTSS